MRLETPITFILLTTVEHDKSKPTCFLTGKGPLTSHVPMKEVPLLANVDKISWIEEDPNRDGSLMFIEGRVFIIVENLSDILSMLRRPIAKGRPPPLPPSGSGVSF